MREQVIKQIEQNKIITIVRGANPVQAVKVAKAVNNGGIRLIEVTFNQKCPETFSDTVKAIKEIKLALPDMVVGAGTVLTIEQVELAKSAGAEYIVSPDADEMVIKRTVELDMVSLPGAYTPSEVKRAHNAGADFVKLFPCADVSYLKALKAPLSHIKFLAVGGVNVENAKDYIDAGAVGVGVGGALVNKKLVDEEKYDIIEQTAREMIKRVLGE